MKSKESPKGPITKPLLQDLANRKKAQDKMNAVVPVIKEPPAKQPGQPALYQDSGNRLNSDFTFPQD